MPLSAALRSLLEAPRYAARTSVHANVVLSAGVTGSPRSPPRLPILHALFEQIVSEAASRGVAWGEWLTISTATLFALNAPGSLRAMLNYVVRHEGALRPLPDRVDRACLMREAGLKCLGLIGTPKTINNLAALRAEVDTDEELAAAMPKEARRYVVTPDPSDIRADMWHRVTQAGNQLWDDIYSKQAQKLRHILAHSHPDLGLYIIQNEYGPLFAPPPAYHEGMAEPAWEINRLRMSLVAIASLHAQGGVAPQVTSHIYGLLRARDRVAHVQGPEAQGLDFLTTEVGAQWVIEMINEICRVVDGTEDADREPGPARL